MATWGSVTQEQMPVPRVFRSIETCEQRTASLSHSQRMQWEKRIARNITRSTSIQCSNCWYEAHQLLVSVRLWEACLSFLPAASTEFAAVTGSGKAVETTSRRHALRVLPAASELFMVMHARNKEPQENPSQRNAGNGAKLWWIDKNRRTACEHHKALTTLCFNVFRMHPIIQPKKTSAVAHLVAWCAKSPCRTKRLNRNPFPLDTSTEAWRIRATRKKWKLYFFTTTNSIKSDIGLTW